MAEEKKQDQSSKSTSRSGSAMVDVVWIKDGTKTKIGFGFGQPEGVTMLMSHAEFATWRGYVEEVK